MDNILITGGAGFIGAHLLTHCLSECSGDIVIIDAFYPAADRTRIQAYFNHPRVHVIENDLMDVATIVKMLSQYNIDTVFHLAAQTHVTVSIHQGVETTTNNVLSTLYLLDALRQAWVHPLTDKLLVFISTDEVYGTQLSAEMATSNSPLIPSNPYAASKGACDMLVHAWHKTYGIPMVITHCTNNYGPGQGLEKLIPLMVCLALEERALTVHGDGQQIRDWIYVDDHCRALVAIAKQPPLGRVCNITANMPLTNLHIVEKIAQILDVKLGRVPGSTAQLIEFVRDRPGQDRRYALENNLAHHGIDWQPKMAFDQGLEETIDWYLGRYQQDINYRQSFLQLASDEQHVWCIPC